MTGEKRWPARALADALRSRTVIESTADGEGRDDLRLLLDDGTVCVIMGAAVTDATLGPDLPLPPYGELKAYIGGRELWPFDQTHDDPDASVGDEHPECVSVPPEEAPARVWARELGGELLAPTADQPPPGSESLSAAVAADERQRMIDHPGIVFRDGPSGRRARLAAGTDVSEVIDGVRGASGDAELDEAGRGSGLTRQQVDIALRYYGEFTDEIDERIRLWSWSTLSTGLPSTASKRPGTSRRSSTARPSPTRSHRSWTTQPAALRHAHLRAALPDLGLERRGPRSALLPGRSGGAGGRGRRTQRGLAVPEGPTRDA